MAARVKVEGLRELDEALGQMTKATARNVLKRTLVRAGQPIADAAREKVPVRSGKLRDSIIVSTKLANPAGKAEFAAEMRNSGDKVKAVGAMRAARRAAGGGAFAEMYVGAGQLPHAHLVEFGSIHNEPPQPYMRPAWDATKQTSLEIIKDALGEEIAKAAARAAKKAARAAAKG